MEVCCGVDLIAYHNYSYEKVAKYIGFSKRMVEYRYQQIVKKISLNLKKRGISNIEDLL